MPTGTGPANNNQDHHTTPRDYTDMPTATLPSSRIPNASPFLLNAEDVDTLSHSQGFTILRQHLAAYYDYELCDCHTPAHLEDVERWLITRDVLHALLVPVVELFDRACGVASAATQATKLEDLEYAFTSSSRSAFVWLQCFLSAEKERDWCYTRGCPACVVEHSLDSEFTIRLLYAACLLSDVHYPFTIEGPTLPSFMFFLDAVHNAVEGDELFGHDFLEVVQPKAMVTRDGIEELIHQCLELDIVLSEPSTPDPISPATSVPPSPILGSCGGTPGIKIRRSKLARKQKSMQLEEAEWLEVMTKQIWDTTQPSIEVGAAAATLLLTQSLDAALKLEPAVAVDELAPE